MRSTIAGIASLIVAAATIGSSDVLTVGPHGSHATIQSAVDDALAAGGDSEIRVAVGTWHEGLELPRQPIDGAIAISGGWLEGFEIRSSDPSLTVIDPGGAGAGVRIQSQGGSLTLAGVTLTNGTHGLDIAAGGTAAIRVAGCRVVGNRAVGDGTETGAGVQAFLADDASLIAEDLVVADNLTEATGQHTSSGAGFRLGAEDRSRLTVRRALVVDNVSRAAANQVTGVGVYLGLADEASAVIEDATFARNRALRPGTHGAAGPGGTLWINDASRLTVARTAWLDNGPADDVYSTQLSLIASGTSVLRFTDAVVAAPDGSLTGGIVAYQRDEGTLDIANCTVSDHPGTGISAARESGRLSVANTIVFGNATDLDLPDGAAAVANLVGIDPLFADPQHWDYRLRSGSPAIGAGTASPPGGLTDSGLMGTARRRGAPVDAGAHVFLEPASRLAVVTHAAGFGGTPWRSDLAWTNATGTAVPLTLTLSRSGARDSVAATAAPGATDVSRDLLVALFGQAADADGAGSLEIAAASPALAWSSRTYADPGQGGTYGQSLPALTAADMLRGGETGVVPMARSDAGFYTNLGFVNGAGTPCTLRVQLVSGNGSQLGSTREVTVPAWEWRQLNDVFPLLGAGGTSTASVTVEVLTPDGAAWAYASIVDRITRDPTTVAVQRLVPAGVSQRVAAIVHLSGIGGTPWRTALAAAAGDTAAHVTLVYRSGDEVTTAAATVPAGGSVAWDDLLVDRFRLDPDSSSAGTLEIISDAPLAAFGRAYADLGDAGTYGQALPALAVGRGGTTSLAPGLLTGLRRDDAGYTNIGVLNLGAGPTQVRITLLGADGAASGTPLVRAVATGQWLQVNDVFTAAGAPDTSEAAARVEVVTAEGRVWAYASVIDRASRDPTTIPVAAVWAVGPLG